MSAERQDMSVQFDCTHSPTRMLVAPEHVGQDAGATGQQEPLLFLLLTLMSPLINTLSKGGVQSTPESP